MTGPVAPERGTPFSRALGEAMRDTDAKAADVAEAVALTPDAVRKWMQGLREPEPQTVFALEEYLRLAPGELSRHLGYVPIGADISVLVAIDADEDLTDRDKKVMRAAYRSLRS